MEKLNVFGEVGKRLNDTLGKSFTGLFGGILTKLNEAKEGAKNMMKPDSAQQPAFDSSSYQAPAVAEEVSQVPAVAEAK